MELSESVQQRLGTLHPEGARELNRINRLAPEATDPSLLTLCGDYIASVLREETWTPPHSLSEKEKAFLAFTEQFATSVSTTSDEQIQALLEFASPDEVYNFVNALYVVDMTQRVDTVAGRLL